MNRAEGVYMTQDTMLSSPHSEKRTVMDRARTLADLKRKPLNHLQNYKNTKELHFTERYGWCKVHFTHMAFKATVDLSHFTALYFFICWLTLQ